MNYLRKKLWNFKAKPRTIVHENQFTFDYSYIRMMITNVKM